MPGFLHSSTAALAIFALGALELPAATYASSSFDITTSWANISPYKDAKSFNLSKGYPQGCELSQVHILHRHAQRYPTASPLDGDGMEDFAAKVANYSKAHSNAAVGRGPLAFLSDWVYTLSLDLLVTTGASTEATAGANFWTNYGRLLYRAGPGVAGWNQSLNVYPNGTARPTPVFRTTSEARILESARWWLSMSSLYLLSCHDLITENSHPTGGFFGNTGANSSYDQYNLVIIPEIDPFNNTLASYDSCPRDEVEGYVE